MMRSRVRVDGTHIISTAQHAIPKVIGHIEPCLAQLTILSKVDKTYSEVSCAYNDNNPHSPAPLRGVSSESWFEPC